MVASEGINQSPTTSWIKGLLTRRRRTPIIPLTIIGVMVMTAVFADFLTAYSPTEISLSTRLRPPFWQERGSLDYLLGTDPMGRDLLTRMIYGARISLLVAVLSLIVGGGIGAALGLIAGYYGGRLDALIMRVADTTMAFPIILFAILFVVVVG
ncbi:MAG TPA: ABC transporter permease subunit, partial [Gammaproteobacteria bacterium]|nr:ABC transporter permease subunit [Gammaproteobacteria bacterium]